jgi:hypothetical protein
MVLVANHWAFFRKENKYVQQGCLSDPLNMDMYSVVLQLPGHLTRYRCLRTTSALEGHFMQHFHKSVKAGARGMGLETLHVRINMFDWSWSVEAAQNASVIPRVGHTWLWLVDALAAICRDLPPGAKLPPSLRKWKPIDTTVEPCTWRGVDWELIKLRQECADAGVDVSNLHPAMKTFPRCSSTPISS